MELLHIHYDDPYMGHYSVKKTTELLHRKFYWKKLQRDIKDYIGMCDIYQ